MVRFYRRYGRRNKKEENYYKDDFDEDNLTDDEVDALASMIILGLINMPVDCGDCPGDAGCC